MKSTLPPEPTVKPIVQSVCVQVMMFLCVWGLWVEMFFQQLEKEAWKNVRSVGCKHEIKIVQVQNNKKGVKKNKRFKHPIKITNSNFLETKKVEITVYNIINKN